MKTLYAYKAYKGNGDIFFTEDQQLINSFKFLGTIEVQEEKKWVKREIKMSDCPLGIKFNNLGTYVPLPSEYRNAVLTYEVLEDDNAETK